MTRPLLLVALLVALTDCASTTNQGTVGIKRQQLLLVSAEALDKSSKQAYANTLQEYHQQEQLNTDPKTLQRLRRIANDIIPQIKAFRQDASRWDWQVNLIESDQLNAWCMPGGRIVFYSGIIHTLKLNDDEIAAIMGHEMAHALREHSREKLSQTQLAQTSLQLAEQLLGLNTSEQQLSAQALQAVMLLPNSRQQEVEADRIGIELAARAGYDPQAVLSLWQKMKQASTHSPPEFLSSHPSHDSRINDLTDYVKKVQHLYQSQQ